MEKDSIRPEARSGFANGALYDQHRPSYPATAVDKLLNAVRVAGIAEANIVDLAAGTGKFTELLAARPEGYIVVAVEPHAEMRKELEKKSLQNVDVDDGLSTSIPVQDGSVDAVIVAQVRDSASVEACMRPCPRSSLSPALSYNAAPCRKSHRGP